MRIKQAGRRLGVRAGIAAAAGLCFLVFLFYALVALTIWLTQFMTLLDAVLVVAGGALLVMLVLLAVLAFEARRHRRLAARRQALDQQLLRTAALAAVPSRLPSRAVTGLGLVATGALLVLLSARRDD